MADVTQEHHEIQVSLGKIETKLEHIGKQLDILHDRIDDREDETKNVEALARSNENRLTAIEATARANRWFILIGFTAASGIGTLLALFFR